MMNSPKLVAIFVALFTVLRIVKFIPTMPAPLYFGIWGILTGYVLLHGKFQINHLTLLFLVLCLLSIVANVIDAKYNVWFRYFGFILIITCVGPLLNNGWIYMLKKNTFFYVSMIMSIVTLVSFIIYCVNPSSMLTTRGQLYGGITIHSMQMGPIAGISMLFMTHEFLMKRTKMRKIQILLWAICIMISLLSCVLAGSRSALGATIVAWLVYAYLYYRNNKKLFFKILAGVIVLFFVTSPFWWTYTETIQAKMEISEQRGGLVTARSTSWADRIDEFKNNPVFGCGFATIVGSNSDRGEGLVEPGNGWLFVLSSTGLVSFITFMTIYFKAFLRLLRLETGISYLLISVLVFIALHLNAEGYTLSSGIFLFFYLWLTLGYAYSLTSNYNQVNESTTFGCVER